MANRNEILDSFLRNPEIKKMCNLTDEELSEITFSKPVDEPLIGALKLMILGSAEKGEPHISTIKAINTLLKSKG